ncbi:hypothetical protein [Rhodococcus globerulus]|uniref:Uncharacterized protein n=1 Tax=Rhodococcus globerulus TaxID=33008 RepID=A0ABU4C5M4_RHOGO|nr:hypothetical protein [Rhodococcus globerulus]MDV6271810.1 hypothetical protein [Rhodococcus globerulus]
MGRLADPFIIIGGDYATMCDGADFVEAQQSELVFRYRSGGGWLPRTEVFECVLFGGLGW